MCENKKFYCVAFFKDGSEHKFTKFPNVASLRVFLDDERPDWVSLDLYSKETGKLLNTYYETQNHFPDWGIIETQGIE